MAYFENLSAAAFKHDDDGNWVYFPHGIITRGRRISSDEEKERIHTSHRRLLKQTIPVAILAGMLLGLTGIPPVPVALFAVYLLACGLNHWRKYRHLPHSDTRLGFNEALDKGSKALPRWYSWVLATISAAVVAYSIALPALIDKPRIHELSLMLGGFGLFGLVMAALLYRVHRRVADRERAVRDSS